MASLNFQSSVYFNTVLSAALIVINGNCNAHLTRTESYDVLIIGAGASGIAAATRLMENGVTNITILEAENRLGGRVYSLPFDHAVLNMGAEWVHGEKGNVVFEMAEKLNLLESSKMSEEYFNGCFLLPSGQVSDPEFSNTMLDLIMEIRNASEFETHEFNRSVGDYYTQRFEEKVMERNLNYKASKPFLNWYHKYHNSVDGSDSWFEISASNIPESWECEGNQEISWKFGGYANVFNLLMNKYISDKPPIFADEKVQYNKEVTRIDWENDNANNTPIVVHCSDGSSYQAPHVIVTVSLGVLKERANTMFHPALPLVKIRAIEGLGIGTVNKIYVKFTHRWWPNEYNGFHLLWTEEDINSTELPVSAGEPTEGKHWLQDVYGFYEVDNYPLVLSGWTVGKTSLHMETLSDEQVTAGVVYLLERFIGRALNVSVPQPERIIRSSWSTNPHFRGSYSFRSVNVDNLETSALHLAEPIANKNGITMLQFAGEATSPHHFSTVHGAIETGWREADRVLAHYGCCRPFLEIIQHKSAGIVGRILQGFPEESRIMRSDAAV